jgi:hypothetical protein
LLIGPEIYYGESIDENRETTVAIIAKVVEEPPLDDLAGVWATLIPRRQVA